MYRVTLGDGTVLDGLHLNGNNFVSVIPVSEETFAGKLRNVKIECTDLSDEEFGGYGGLVGEHAQMELVQIMRTTEDLGGEWWFILRDIDPAELERVRLRGDVDYIAMMTGVEL